MMSGQRQEGETAVDYYRIDNHDIIIYYSKHTFETGFESSVILGWLVSQQDSDTGKHAFVFCKDRNGSKSLGLRVLTNSNNFAKNRV